MTVSPLYQHSADVLCTGVTAPVRLPRPVGDEGSKYVRRRWQPGSPPESSDRNASSDEERVEPSSSGRPRKMLPKLLSRCGQWANAVQHRRRHQPTAKLRRASEGSDDGTATGDRSSHLWEDYWGTSSVRLFAARRDGVDHVFVDHPLFRTGDECGPSQMTYSDGSSACSSSSSSSEEVGEMPASLTAQLRASLLCQAALAAPALLWLSPELRGRVRDTSSGTSPLPMAVQQGIGRPCIWGDNLDRASMETSSSLRSTLSRLRLHAAGRAGRLLPQSSAFGPGRPGSRSRQRSWGLQSWGLQSSKIAPSVGGQEEENPVVFVANDWPAGLLPLWLDAYSDNVQGLGGHRMQLPEANGGMGTGPGWPAIDSLESGAAKEDQRAAATGLPSVPDAEPPVARQQLIHDGRPGAHPLSSSASEEKRSISPLGGLFSIGISSRDLRRQKRSRSTALSTAASGVDSHWALEGALRRFQSLVRSKLHDARFVLAIHNFGFHGLFSEQEFLSLGLPMRHLPLLLTSGPAAAASPGTQPLGPPSASNGDALPPSPQPRLDSEPSPPPGTQTQPQQRQISWLQAALLTSDLILTVSPHHASELADAALDSLASGPQPIAAAAAASSPAGGPRPSEAMSAALLLGAAASGGISTLGSWAKAAASGFSRGWARLSRGAGLRKESRRPKPGVESSADAATVANYDSGGSSDHLDGQVAAMVPNGTADSPAPSCCRTTADATGSGCRLLGIMNGVDTSVWDPTQDPLLPAELRFGPHSVGEGKARAKHALQVGGRERERSGESLSFLFVEIEFYFSHLWTLRLIILL